MLFEGLPRDGPRPGRRAECVGWLMDSFGRPRENPYLRIPFLLGFCICPEKICCMYDMNVVESYAKLAKKKTTTPGPFNNLCLDSFLCNSCIYCAMYRELKLTPCGGQKEAPAFLSIEREK